MGGTYGALKCNASPANAVYGTGGREAPPPECPSASYPPCRSQCVGSGEGTRVEANIAGQLEVFGLFSTGGRQFLRTSAGALDLRWHFNQHFNSDSCAKIASAFDPGGNGATFGFLRWAWRYSSYGIPTNYSGAGGLARNVEAADATDPDFYGYANGAYWRYDVPARAYYHYESGSPLSHPRYIRRLVREQGETTYYEYADSRLRCMRPAAGRAAVYFGYDDAYHINRMYIQDLGGDDHRATYYYYSSNALTALVEPEEAVTYFTVAGTSGAGIVTREVDPDGHVTYLVYDTVAGAGLDKLQHEGRVTYFADTGTVSSGRTPAGVIPVQYQRSTFNHSWWVTREVRGPGTTYYQYDANAKLIGRMDPNGNRTSYGSPNARNMRLRYQTADEGTTYYRYAANEMDVVAEQGPRHSAAVPQVTYYGYDERSLRTQVRDPLGYAAYYGYDELGRLTRTLDARGAAAYFYYDAYGQQAVQLDALLNAAYFGYNANGEATRRQDALGYTWYYTYDKMDQPLAQECPTGARWSYAYSKRGLVLRQEEPGARGTYYEYDAYRNVTRAARQDEDGFAATYYEYDELDRLTAVTDPNGNRTAYDSDVRGLRVKALDAAGAATYFGYDLAGNLSAVQDANGFATYYAYDAVNRVAQVRREDRVLAASAYDVDGNRWWSQNGRAATTLSGFDLKNRPVQVRDPLVQATYFGYDASDHLIRNLNARGVATYFGYDLASRQVAQLDGLGRATYFGYDAVGNRVAILAPGERTAYFGYDGNGSLRRAADAEGFTTYYEYSSCNELDRITDARGNTTAFTYDELGRRSTVLDALGQPVQYAYDLTDNLTRVVDHHTVSGEAATYFVYDAVNRLTARVDALSRTTYFGYDAVGQQTRVMRPGNRVLETGYDKYGDRARIVAPDGSATYFGYDAASNPVRSLSPRGYAAYFAYDKLDRVTRGLDARGGGTYFAYDGNGNRTAVVDERGFCTYFAYDELDRLSRRTDARGGVTEQGYDASGNLAAVKPPAGAAAYFAYSPRGLLTASVDGAGNAAYFGYDEAGNRARAVSPRGYHTYFGYDALNRLDAVADAEGGRAEFGYDVGGNTAATLDPLGRAAYFYYDLTDELLAARDALGNAVYFGYDEAGNRTAEQDARGRAAYYFYDVGDRLSASVDAVGVASYYGYDASSNLARTEDANGQAAYFGYDALERRTRILYQGMTANPGYGTQGYGTTPYGGGTSDETAYFGYDAAGNLTATRDSWGGAYYAYDALNRLTARTTPRGDAVYYAYDAASGLVRVQYPQALESAYFGYDAALRLEKLRTPSGQGTYFAYDESSNCIRRQFGNGVTAYWTFDKAERVTAIRYAKGDGAAVASFEFNRDVAGRITKLARENDLAVYYGYDDVDRLTAEVWRKASDSTQVYAFTYEYDAANNRLKMRREGATEGSEAESAYYAYDDANALSRKLLQPAGDATYYVYDANGGLTQMVAPAGTTYYEYGPHRLVTRIAPPDGDELRFFYDANLNRYKIERGTAVTQYLWDGLNQLEERDQTGNLLARYTHGVSRIAGIGSVVEVERHVGTATYFQYLVQDHRGTTHKVSDADGETQIEYAQDAFGRPLADPTGADPSVPNDLIYQANWLTLPVGTQRLCLSKYRVYDPELGIFLSRDFLQGFNRYSAFDNEPTSINDTEGLVGCGTEAAPAAEAGPKLSEEEIRKQLLAAMERAKAAKDLTLQEKIYSALELIDKGQGNRAYAMAKQAGVLGQLSTEWWYKAGQGTTDFVRGAGSALTFGATDYVREKLVWEKYGADFSNVRNQWAYVGGNVAGTLLQIGITGGLATSVKGGIGLAGRSTTARLLTRWMGQKGANAFATQWARRGSLAYDLADLAHGVYQTGAAGYRIASAMLDPCQDVSLLDIATLAAGAYGLRGAHLSLWKFNPRLAGRVRNPRAHLPGHHTIIPHGGRGPLTYRGLMTNQWGRFVPSWLRDLPGFNIVNRGNLWHYRVDPHFRGTKAWRPPLGARKYDMLGRLWYGSPTWLRVTGASMAVADIFGWGYLLTEHASAGEREEDGEYGSSPYVEE